MPQLTYHSTTVILIFAPMLLNLSQMPIGMKTYHSQVSPVIHGPNRYPDPLSPLYVIVHPRKLIHRILLFAASRKECHIDRSSSYHFRVMAVWNLSQDSHKARAPPRPPRPRPHPLPHVQMLYIQAERPLRLLVSRLEVVATWRRKLVLQCVVLRLRFDSVALELLCIF